MYLNQQALRRSAQNRSRCPRPGMTFRTSSATDGCGLRLSVPSADRTGSSSTTPAPGTMSRPFRMNGKNPCHQRHASGQHIAKMASWYQARYLQLFDGEGEASGDSRAANIAVLTASSAAYAEFRDKTGFEVAVAPRPTTRGYPGRRRTPWPTAPRWGRRRAQQAGPPWRRPPGELLVQSGGAGRLAA